MNGLDFCCGSELRAFRISVRYWTLAPTLRLASPITKPRRAFKDLSKSAVLRAVLTATLRDAEG